MTLSLVHVQQKGLVTRYTHMKYEGPKTKGQTEGPKTIYPRSMNAGA